MGRCLAAALVLLTSMPSLALAQVAHMGLEEPFAPGRITVAAYAGYRYRYAATFDEVLESGSQQIFARERIEVDAAPVVGASVSVPFTGRFSFVGAAAYGFSGSGSVISVSSEGTQAGLLADAGTFLFARAGFGYQFLDTSPENALRRVAATASLAPALVLLDPAGNDPNLESDDMLTNLGVAFSANGIIPLTPWPSFAIHVGLEDFVTFWNTGSLASRLATDLGRATGTTVRAEVDADPTNILMAHVGLRVRF